MAHPLISIYMPTHNRVELLSRAIKSVQRQTLQDFELIIVDDGSTDETWEYLSALQKSYSNISCVRVEVAKGACNARNIAINLAQGKYITGLDDDDEFDSNRLEVLLASYHTNYAFVCTNFMEVKGGKSTCNESMGNDSIRNVESLKYQNTASNQVFTETSKLLAVNAFNTKMKKLQDWDVWLRLSLKYGDFLKLSSPLYIMHHDHEGPRVTDNLSYGNAFEALIEQNKIHFTFHELRRLKLRGKYLRSQLSCLDVVSNIKQLNDYVLVKWYVYQTLKYLLK